jgi:hypothetical protein
LNEDNKAKLLFRVEGAQPGTMDKLKERLELDFSRIEKIVPSGTGGAWLVTSVPLHVEEFGAVVSHIRRVTQLMKGSDSLEISPAYLRPRQLVIVADPDDPQGVFLSRDTSARVAASATADGKWTNHSSEPAGEELKKLTEAAGD